MIRTGTLSTQPDPAIVALQADLQHQRTRLQDWAASLDPAEVPQGIADAIHDALTNLTDALQVAEVVSWGWNG